MRQRQYADNPRLLYSVIKFRTKTFIVCEFCANHWQPQDWPPDHEHHCQGLALTEPHQSPLLYCGNCGEQGEGRHRPNPFRLMEKAMGGVHLTLCTFCIAKSTTELSHAAR